jgi:hypothetical protein
VTEQWKDIPGFEGQYQVSTLGRVSSYGRRVNSRRGTRVFAGRVLRAIKTDRGYTVVNLSVGRKRLQMPVHRAVLLAWRGIPDGGMQACHNNGIADDNRLDNLRWDTALNNIADREAHGTKLIGERNPRAKLTEEMVRLIRSSARPLKALSRELGVPYSAAKKAKYGATWSHVR